MTQRNQRPPGLGMGETGAIGAPPGRAATGIPENRLLGIALMVAAMMIVPFMDALAKHLSDRYAVSQLTWARFFFHLAILAPIVLYHHGRRALRPAQPGLQLLRSGFTLLATILFFAAIARMPIADALALLFVSPMVVTALSPVMLDERVGMRRWVAVAAGFAGALIILRPGFGVAQAGSFLAMGAGISFAFYTLLTRRLSGTAPPLVTLAYTAVTGAAVMSIAVIPDWITPSPGDLLMMCGIGAIAATGHFLLIRAFDYAPASLLAPYSYSEIVMATAVGWFVFSDFPDRWTWAGIIVIVASGIYISWRERKHKTT
ncbi:MAG: DMT family transporter [Rhodospirillales bacterium]|nr:MAG: DMT family transporter [Rhodospirillales bacterium]